jgi:putative membrane protein
MTTQELLLTAWDWEPSVVAGCAALAIGYLALALVGRTPWSAADAPVGHAPAQDKKPARGPVADRGVRPTILFLSGTLLLLLALVSPLDTLADGYLFSAHVVQHILLALIIPPLWLLGTPRALAEAALQRPLIRQIERALAQPLIAWPLGVATMILWHLPPLFNAALASDSLHIFQHLSFLITGTIFWWPVLGPIPERRIAPLHYAIAYLFSACVCCSLLGALLTFTPPGAYPAYLNPDDRLGILRLVRTGWGLDPKTDQQLGGLLMWVPGCFVYLSGILATTARWYGTAEQEA